MIWKVAIVALFVLCLVAGIEIFSPQVQAAPEESATDRTGSTGSGSLGSGSTGAGDLGSGSPGAGNLGYGTTPACTAGDSTCLKNPLDPSISSIPAFFLAILDILLVFAIPLVVFFIIYAGFMYVTAQGNPGKIQQAHMALLYALIGAVLIFGARAILNIITNTVDSVTYVSSERWL